MVRADPPSAVLHGHVGRNRDLYPRSNALHSACYWVSDRYKFIGIKLAKAGGSSMIKFLKSALCGVQVQGAFNVSASCPDIAVLNHGQREQSDCLHKLPPARKWREYFVFAVVRNPYARRASMVRYCGVAGGDLVRGIPYRAGCGSCASIHCTPVAPALLRGNSTLVDFVGRVESLQADLETILNEVQRRNGRGIEWRNTTPAGGASLWANPTLPRPIRSSHSSWSRQAHDLAWWAMWAPQRLLWPRTKTRSQLSYEGWMATCGLSCVTQIEMDYRTDVDLLGYLRPDLHRGAAELRRAILCDVAASSALLLLLPLLVSAVLFFCSIRRPSLRPRVSHLPPPFTGYTFGIYGSGLYDATGGPTTRMLHL